VEDDPFGQANRQSAGSYDPHEDIRAQQGGRDRRGLVDWLFGPRSFGGGRVQVYGCSPGCLLVSLLVSIVLSVALTLLLNFLLRQL